MYQEVNLCTNLSIGENVMLGHEVRGTLGINWKKTYEESKKFLAQMGLDHLDRLLHLYYGPAIGQGDLAAMYPPGRPGLLTQPQRRPGAPGHLAGRAASGVHRLQHRRLPSFLPGGAGGKRAAGAEWHYASHSIQKANTP